MDSQRPLRKCVSADVERLRLRVIDARTPVAQEKQKPVGGGATLKGSAHGLCHHRWFLIVATGDAPISRSTSADTSRLCEWIRGMCGMVVGQVRPGVGFTTFHCRLSQRVNVPQVR